MNTDDPPLRRLRQLRGFGALAVAAAFAASLVWAPLPSPAGITGGIVVGLIALFGGVQLWLARKTPMSVRVPSRFSDPNRLPVPQRVRYFRRQLLLCSIIFPLASALTAFELNRVEAGVIATARLMFPIGFMYERFGFWPAVLVMPTLGAVFYWGLLFKLKQLEHINDSDA